MPYGRGKSRRMSSTVARQRTARQAAFKKARTKNKPVAKALRAPRPVRKSVTGRNRLAIGTLAKQVRTLQIERFGYKQTHRLITLFDPNYTPGIGKGQTPEPLQPLAFMVNDFTKHQWYKGVVTPTIGVQDNGTANTMDDNPSIPNAYNWNKHNRDLTVDIREGYMPVAKYFTLRTEVTIPPTTQISPMRLRIQFFQFVRYRTQATFASTYGLPTTLGAYQSLCAMPVIDQTFGRNKLNPEIHKVLLDKYIYVTPPQGDKWVHSGTPTKYTKVMNFKQYFPSKFLKTTVDGGSELTDLWGHIPVQDQIWCVISSDKDKYFQETIRFQMSLTENQYWRDSSGIAGI